MENEKAKIEREGLVCFDNGKKQSRMRKVVRAESSWGSWEGR